MKLIDLTGQRFGKLTVLHRAPDYEGGGTRWLCLCMCGQECVVDAHRLKHGQAGLCRECNQSQAAERAAKNNTRHGEARHGAQTAEYRAWHSMKDRCCNPGSSHYRYYGARGVSVCHKWRDSFAEFLKDVGRRPGSGYSLDRIKVDGDYEPGNCRWATASMQANNRRSTIFLTWQGRTQTAAEWARELGIKWVTLWHRYNKGYPVEYVLSRSRVPFRWQLGIK